MRELRALVCDDEWHVRLFLKDVLKKEGIQVVAEARNGEQAVEMFRKHKPDLTLLDINMPEMNGDEALRNILQESPDATVIMLTCKINAETVTKFIDLGAANYVRKDTPLPEMQKLIRETVRERFPE